MSGTHVLQVGGAAEAHGLMWSLLLPSSPAAPAAPAAATGGQAQLLKRLSSLLVTEAEVCVPCEAALKLHLLSFRDTSSF